MERMYTFMFYKYAGSKTIRRTKLYYYGEDNEAMEWARNEMLKRDWDEVVLDCVRDEEYYD